MLYLFLVREDKSFSNFYMSDQTAFSFKEKVVFFVRSNCSAKLQLRASNLFALELPQIWQAMKLDLPPFLFEPYNCSAKFQLRAVFKTPCRGTFIFPNKKPKYNLKYCTWERKKTFTDNRQVPFKRSLKAF